jgi:hypothetical protein
MGQIIAVYSNPARCHRHTETQGARVPLRGLATLLRRKSDFFGNSHEMLKAQAGNPMPMPLFYAQTCCENSLASS